MKGTSKKAFLWLAIIVISFFLPLHSPAASSMYDDPSSSNSQEDKKDPEKTDAQKDDDENQKKKKKDSVDEAIAEADKIMKDWQAQEAAAAAQSSGSYSGSGQSSSSAPASGGVSDTSSEMYPSDASRATEPVSELQTETLPESEYASSPEASQVGGQEPTAPAAQPEAAPEFSQSTTTTPDITPEASSTSTEPTSAGTEVTQGNDWISKDQIDAAAQASTPTEEVPSVEPKSWGDAFDELKNSAVEKAAEIKDTVFQKASELTDSAVQSLKDAGEYIKTTASDLTKTASNTIDSAGKYVSDAAESISKTFTDAYENASSSLKEAASFAKDDFFSPSDTTSSFDQGLTGSEQASVEKPLSETTTTPAKEESFFSENTDGFEGDLSDSTPSIPDSEIEELKTEPVKTNPADLPKDLKTTVQEALKNMEDPNYNGPKVDPDKIAKLEKQLGLQPGSLLDADKIKGADVEKYMKGIIRGEGGLEGSKFFNDPEYLAKAQEAYNAGDFKNVKVAGQNRTIYDVDGKPSIYSVPNAEGSSATGTVQAMKGWQEMTGKLFMDRVPTQMEFMNPSYQTIATRLEAAYNLAQQGGSISRATNVHKTGSP